MRVRGWRAAGVALGAVLALGPAELPAQDLFELEVFEYDVTAPGEFDVELHVNAVSRGAVAPESVEGDHRPTHVSVEIARGWADRFETALFIQTAPFGSDGAARFAGGHVRGKVQLAALRPVPLRIAVSAEYTVNRAAFDDELQTLEIRPILDYRQGRLSLVANPSVEMVTRGSDEGVEPVFDLSARGVWRLLEAMALTADYFSAAATTRHLQHEVDAHHLLFGGVELDVGSGWELGLALGHCVTSGEPWLVRSVIGYGF
jgi:hypothetical protein